MERSHLFLLLARHRNVFHAMLSGMAPAEVLWKSAPEKWCALEIICHLYDEEREDFRARLKSVLDTPDQPFVKIDPPAWVMERKYMEQDFEATLKDFLHEREQSLAWLHSLTEAPWNNFYMHPTVGPVSCDLLLSNWVAHDLHHIRQLVNLRYAYLKAHTAVPLDYAGTW
jgi:DinB superfamily